PSPAARPPPHPHCPYPSLFRSPWAIQFPRVNPATGERDWTMLTEPRHPSQLYEAGVEGVVLFAVLLWLALSRRWLKCPGAITGVDRKSTRLNSSHVKSSYAVFC